MHDLDLALKYAIEGEFLKSNKILDKLSKENLPGDNNLRVRYNKGWHEFRAGNLLRGYEGLNAGRWFKVFGSPPIQANTPIWKNEPLKNKTILFNSEGGFGDEIINIRFAKDFCDKGAKVIVSCHRDLFPLFRNLSYVHHCVDRNFADGVDHDYWIPAMSAPYILNMEYKDLNPEPYLPLQEKINIPGKIKVGFRWSGNPMFEHQQFRKFPREKMFSLFKENITAVCLQRDLDMENLPKNLHKVSLNTWLDTAKAISSLDLVITSCTSIAHLSSAMGIPTWVIVPVLPYYIWALPGNKSLWYKNTTIYRQTEFGNWDDIFTIIEKDLHGYVESKI
jgi:hypothetical protein